MCEIGEVVRQIIRLVELQFKTEMDELSFLLGYYTAQGSRRNLVNTLKYHAMANEGLRDVAEIAEKMLLHDMNNLRTMIIELCNKRGCNIPEWLRNVEEVMGDEV
jgi:hypothetical protein